MRTDEFLMNLQNSGAELWTEEGRIKYKFPKGLLTEDVKQEIIKRREEILSILENGLVSNAKSNIAGEENIYEPFALTDMQEAYWMGEGGYFDFGNVSAHLYAEYDFFQVDVENINKAWNKIIQRHEMLRAIVLRDGNQQILREVPEYVIQYNDLVLLSDGERNERLLKTQDRMANEGPKSNDWPLFELVISQLDKDNIRLHVNISLIICDGLSAQILMKEFGELIRNPELVFPNINFSYKSYIKALKDNEKTQSYLKAQDYWLSRAKQFPMSPELPLKRGKKPAIPSFTRHANILSAEKWQRLKQISSAYKLTPSALVAAAYTYILSKWNRNSHFAINMMYVNRLPLHKDIYNVVGNFSSTLLLEVNLTNKENFAEFAQSLKERLFNDMNHTGFSGVRLIRELNRINGGSDRAAMPIILASMLFSNFNEAGYSDYTKHMKMVCSKLQTPQVWLDHQVFEEDGMLKYNWDEANEVFPSGMVSSMFKAYNNLLEELIYNENIWNAPLPDVIEPSQLEKRKIVNTTNKKFEICLLHEPFINKARQFPDNIAIETSTKKITYGELQIYSNQVAGYLRKQDVKPNQFVSVIMEKGWEQVVAILGILKSGAAYLPIHPKIPKERIGYLLNNAKSSIVIAQDGLLTKLELPDGLTVVGIDQILNTEVQIIIENSIQQKEDLAYVIYTSGSTGEPKGVMIRHEAVVNTILDINSRYNVNSNDKFFAISALNFDLSVYDVFGALSTGGTIVIPDESKLMEPSAWLEMINNKKVTIWNSVPALMQMLVEYIDVPKNDLTQSLRLVIMSGDWIPVSLPDKIKQLYRDCKVISMGGATEASIWSIFHPIDFVDSNLPSIPYGKALANQKMFVLDKKLYYTPDWVPGDIYIGGIGLSDGYLNDEQKTNKSFIIHPSFKERIYKTGDLGRFLPDGNIEFLGREDFQVKIQGYRIELGEIETAIIKHEGILDAIVSVHGKKAESKRLICYYTENHNFSLEKEEMISFLSTKLPDYMIPNTFIKMESLPLTSNGKVDRTALPSPEEIEDDRIKCKEITAPRNGIETKLYQLFEQLLSLKKLCIFDNFFELGGNSILAIQLINKIEKEFTVQVSMHNFLENQSVAKLSHVIQNKEVSKNTSLVVAINKNGTQTPIFMVHPVGGNVMCYVQLAKHLGEDQPLYGIQANGMDEGEIISSIEDMAARYISEIKKYHHNELVLGGWSMGALVALQMAKLLSSENIMVKNLILIDPPVINSKQIIDTDFTCIIRDYAIDNHTSLNLLKLNELQLKKLSKDEQLELFYKQAKGIGVLPNELGMMQFTKMFNVFEANLKAMWNYKTSTYNGRVALYMANEHDSTWESAIESWLNILSTETLTEDMDANHYSMMEEPIVKILAQKITKSLSITAE